MILCPTRACFGIDCPLCGGLRMVGSLARGDLPAALHYNAVALGFLLLCFWRVTRSGRLAALKVISRRRGVPVRTWRHWRWTPVVSGVVFVVWFVVRNLPFAPFTGLFV